MIFTVQKFAVLTKKRDRDKRKRKQDKKTGLSHSTAKPLKHWNEAKYVFASIRWKLWMDLPFIGTRVKWQHPDSACTHRWPNCIRGSELRVSHAVGKAPRPAGCVLAGDLEPSISCLKTRSGTCRLWHFSWQKFNSWFHIKYHLNVSN